MLHAVEAAAAAALRDVVPAEHADAALADLKRRLAGWPMALATAASAPPSEAVPHAPLPAHAAVATQSTNASRGDAIGFGAESGAATAGASSVPPAWALAACAAVDRSTCVRQLWQLPCGAWLLLEARCVPSTRGVGGASYVVTALTDAVRSSLWITCHCCLLTYALFLSRFTTDGPLPKTPLLPLYCWRVLRCSRARRRCVGVPHARAPSGAAGCSCGGRRPWRHAAAACAWAAPGSGAVAARRRRRCTLFSAAITGRASSQRRSRGATNMRYVFCFGC